jgi:hypothetical protein
MGRGFPDSGCGLRADRRCPIRSRAFACTRWPKRWPCPRARGASSSRSRCWCRPGGPAFPILEVPVPVTYHPPGGRVSHFRPWRDFGRNAATFTRLIATRFVPARRRKDPPVKRVNRPFAGACCSSPAWRAALSGLGWPATACASTRTSPRRCPRAAWPSRARARCWPATPRSTAWSSTCRCATARPARRAHRRGRRGGGRAGALGALHDGGHGRGGARDHGALRRSAVAAAAAVFARGIGAPGGSAPRTRRAVGAAGDLAAEAADLSGIGAASRVAEDPLGLGEIALARLGDLVPTQQGRIERGHILDTEGKNLLVAAVPREVTRDTRASHAIDDAIQAWPALRTGQGRRGRRGRGADSRGRLPRGHRQRNAGHARREPGHAGVHHRHRAAAAGVFSAAVAGRVRACFPRWRAAAWRFSSTA